MRFMAAILSLFDANRNRPLPKFPRRVALVTSSTGAAVQDMVQVLKRRSPWLSILICPKESRAFAEISGMKRGEVAGFENRLKRIAVSN
jgi:hypothetical protein